MGDIFDSERGIKWYHYFIHLGYYIPYWGKFFFSRPFKQAKKKDLDVLDKVGTLLDSETTNENIANCKELVNLHRIIENTRARRRLEKWSLRIIAVYLILVLFIVVTCYIRHEKFHILNIPDTIMITILSTTTINIIGLGLIVLRGHFLANDMYKIRNKKTHKSKLH